VWLSRFLTVPHKSLCTCDAIGHVESAEEFWARGEQIARERNLEYYGNCELLNLTILPSLIATRPLTCVLYVDREIISSMMASQRAGQGIPAEMWNALGEYRLRHRAHFDAIIPYDLLGDASTMKALWELVLPGVAWNQARWEAFSRKRITCKKPTLSVDHFDRLKAFLGREAEPV
jgi:hypothetical protein